MVESEYAVQLHDASDLTRLRAVGILFRRLFRLVLLLLHVRQPLLIVFQVAVKRLDFTVVHQIEIVRGGADQVTIVRDHNQRALKLNQRFGQRLTHVEVEVVGRFIEQQQVRALPDDQRQHQTRFFAAGETLCVFSDLITPKPKPPR